MEKLEEDIINLVLSECTELDNILNSVILKKFAELHNIKPEKSLFKLKQEVIAKNSIFLDVKKRYALYIINNEGKPCSKFEIKGMITQRSEYPEFTKAKISELLNIILTDDYIDFAKIHEFCEQSRTEILEKCINHDKSIAGMGSMRNDMDSYVKKPYQVLAMELWNELEYNYFVPGTKGYIYKILGIDMELAPKYVRNKSDIISNKNKYIAVPFEVANLPEYYIIDVENHIRYAWDDRQHEIMRVLKGDFQNAQISEGIFEEFESDPES